MGFRDDKQLTAACRVLTYRVRRKGVTWTDNGPSEAALEVLAGRSGLSHGEQLITLVAFAFFNGEKPVDLGAVLSVMDADHLCLIGSLLVAVGRGMDAVDQWLDDNEWRDRHGG